ncbi:MAG: hypothetical protein EHM93_00830 [Bacteroidales bacterium]|nr:MAG: hypothetical protein EHM93_00830 [Bacteroidales bacterium]
MKFQVGEWYFFTIENILKFPEKGEHYILKHESGRKMLLNAIYYVKYNFVIGQTIECRVDKVSCTGQVFLEPRHPMYCEGSIYHFMQLGIKKNIDKSLSLLVKDTFENEIEVYLSQPYELTDDEIVSLKVEKIKKGCPILTLPNAKEFFYNSKHSDIITLKVIALVAVNSEEYFSLADSNGRIASRLKVKHYSHYGLKIGHYYQCRINGFNHNGLMLVEPENPWYKIGESYIFKINSVENFINLEGEEVQGAIVLDKTKNKCGVVLSAEQEQRMKKENQTKVKCKVIGFRKGRPQLEIDLY